MSRETDDAELQDLELITFGVPAVRLGGGTPPPEVEWRKNLALLVYLAMSPDRTRSRSQIIGLLWPEATEQRARHSLNEAVRRLRAALGVARLRSTGAGENLTLSGDGLSVDATEFERLADSDGTQALQILRGEFLEGFSLDNSHAFDSWLLSRREHYRSRSMQLLIGAGERALADSRHEAAAEYARRALRTEPFSEPAADLLMRALALQGDSTGALAVYAEFRSGVERELNEDPSVNLRDLAERLRSGRWLRASASYADVDPPLVGPGDAGQTAFALVMRAGTTGPHGLAVLADPGLGRTRLLAECAARFALQGGVTVVARPLESDLDAPWSTLRALARGGLTAAPGVAGTAPSQLSVLASIVPGITSATPAVEPRDTAEVAAALAELLGAAADERPLLLAIDDAHFADQATLGALHGAMLQLDKAPVLFVLTTLSDVQDASKELLRLRGEIGRGIPGSTVSLIPFGESDIGQLVSAMANWCVDDDERKRLTRRVAFDTGGSPFLAVTLLRGLEHAVTLRDDIKSWPQRDVTLDAPLPISVPDLARMAIIANLTALPLSTRDVVAAASILDVLVDVKLLSHLLSRSVTEVERELATLERTRLLTFDGERYAFVAPLIAQIVKAELLTSGQRRSLLDRAIEALANRDDLEGKLLRVQLLAENHPSRETAVEAGAVARAASTAGAARTARRAVAAAARALRKGGDDDAAFVSELRKEIAGKPA